MKILGISLGHDAHICVVEDAQLKFVLEPERLFRQKHHKLHALHLHENNYSNGFQECNVKDLKQTLEEVTSRYGFEYDYIAVQNQQRQPEFKNLNKLLKELGFKFKGIENFNHHLSHAGGSYFTSPFKESLILSFDGAGNDGNSIILQGRGNKIEYLERTHIKFGNSYNNLGFIGNIGADISGCTAGKTMGITSYGKVVKAWVPLMKKHILNYAKAPRKPVQGLSSFGSNHSIQWAHLNQIKEIQPYIDGENSKLTVKDELYHNFAKTFQHAWSELVVDFVKKHASVSKNLCVVGGCALNGITNYILEECGLFDQVHFIPNPSDCGLAIGAALLSHYKNSQQEFSGAVSYLSPYLGPEAYDKKNLETLKSQYKHKELDPTETPKVLANLICDNKIIGNIRGKSEIGPRALGNRSILCNSQNKEMRDILNHKVKNREWFRPFAPVCIAEKANKYFTNAREIPYMSVICYTKEEYRDLLPSITHVDGSSRLQTVKEDQHPFLYKTLENIEKINGAPICLNTSFNPGGEPILNYYHVGLQMLKDTDLDYVLIEDTLFWHKEENNV